MKRFLQLALFIFGITLFAFVIKTVGWHKLGVIFPALSGWGWLVFLFYALMCFPDVFGWRTVFDHQWAKKLNLWQLYLIRLAGEAVNNITPFLDVGGEFLKVHLVEKRLAITKKGALAACVMCRSAMLFSEIIFVILGLAFASLVAPLPNRIKTTLIAALSICVIVALFLIKAQKQGLFITIIHWCERLGIDPKLFKRFHTSLQAIDTEIAKFYSHEAKRLWLAMGFHFIGWLSGGIEIFFMLRLLGVPVNLLESTVLEALYHLIRTAGVLIPISLGVQEGGLALILGFMGVDPSLGVALSLMKRARQLIWTSVGFFIWGIYQLLELKGVNNKA